VRKRDSQEIQPVDHGRTTILNVPIGE
jgi:hypothetical protein